MSDLARPHPLDAALEALYAELPKIQCRGLCAEACGPVPMSAAEAARAERHAGRLPGVRAGTRDCTYLTREGRCSIYAVRPMVCRLYGVDPALPCRFGCKPERWLNPLEGRQWMQRAFALDQSSDVGAIVRALRPVHSPADNSLRLC